MGLTVGGVVKGGDTVGRNGGAVTVAGVERFTGGTGGMLTGTAGESPGGRVGKYFWLVVIRSPTGPVDAFDAAPSVAIPSSGLQGCTCWAS